MLPRQEGLPARLCPLLDGPGNEDRVWGSDLCGWEGLGETEEGMKALGRGLLPTPGLDQALGLLRCKSAVLDLELGESHSQPSAAVTIATRGYLGKRLLCWAREAATEQG